MISRFLSERIIIIISYIYIYTHTHIVLVLFFKFYFVKVFQTKNNKNLVMPLHVTICLCYLQHLDVLYIYTLIYDIVNRMRVHQISANYVRISIKKISGMLCK